ncbi:MAG TPA: sigma-54 dependent transcriptional regulator [Bdellovibrionota bacterium]|jgi:nitrogen regulation protein NR(I)|nr:sigma-54 dependent transcriptional regulator [Bdellovibrionota bacterium]
MTSKILVIDDEKNVAFVMSATLQKAGFDVVTVNDPRAAFGLIDQEGLDLVITDLMMPEVTGMEILEYCARHFPRLPVVMVTAHGTVESAVTALKRGAFDFVTKPFDRQELLNVVKKAVETHRRSKNEPIGVPEQPSEGDRSLVSPLVGSSPQMQEIFKVIGKVAPSPTTVLITGESGTGKELVAVEIHARSDRARKPFIKINCAAIPATLIESEFFGYERGAFTGAVGSKPGRFELAHEGTLFLDEVADMPPEMQVKLLRALQEKEFERVGGVSPIRVDVRIIAATNKDLEKEVAEGRFREDLFYRLNVVPIQLPPLRERRDDLVTLIGYFIERFNGKLGKNISKLEPACFAALRSFGWPGNIRQLENVIERMVLMSEGDTLLAAGLPDPIRDAAVSPSAEPTAQELEDLSNFKEIVRRRMQDLERTFIERALEETEGNVTRAAERLGLSRKGLQLKMKELGIRQK